MMNEHLLIKIVEAQYETAETIHKIVLVQAEIIKLQSQHNEILKQMKDKIDWLETMERVREGKEYLI